MYLLLQAVPGPGQYEIKSQFEKQVGSLDGDEEESGEAGRAPFGSSLQVCV